MITKPSYGQRGHSDSAGAEAHWPQAAAPKGAQETDPLAELARLIGQTDPFTNFARSSSGEADGHRQPVFSEPHVAAFPVDDEAGTPHAGWRKPSPASDARAIDADPQFGADDDRPSAASVHYDQPRHAPPPPAWTRHGVDDRMALDDDGAPPIPAFLKSAHPAPGQPAHHHSQAAQPGPYDGVLYGELPLTRQAEPAHREPAYGSSPYGTDAASAGAGYDPRDPYGQSYDEYAAYDQNGDYAEEQPPEPRRRGFALVAAIVGLAIVGTAGAYGYRSFVSGSRSGAPPVIKADTSPNKIVPPRKDGEQSNKLIYDRIGNTPSDSQIVPREEQPVDVAGTAQSPRIVFPQLSQPNQQPAPSTDPAANGIARIAADSARPRQAAIGEEPKKIRTLTIRPDQQGLGQDSAAPAAPEPAPAATPVKPQRVARAPASDQDAAPINIAPQQNAAVTAAASNPSAGAYLVQVSSQRSEGDARASYRALQGKFPAVLGSREAVIRKADLGDKGVYFRAMVGPFTNPADATRVCSDLKAAGGQCVVQRN